MRSSKLFLGALASSHASETGCTADDESSLLQAHLQKLKKKNAATMLLESSEGIARSLMSGESPEAVNNAIAEIRSALEEIGPMLQEEHLNAQSQIDQQLDEIQACHSSSDHGSAVMGNLAGELATMTQCMADQTSANQAQELYCSEWSNHAHQLSFPSCSSPSSAGLEGIYSTAQNLQNWVEDQWENIHSKYTACTQATTHATDETTRCAPVIAEYDERFCQHELACSLRTACHEHEVSVYNALVSASEEGMVARQEHHHTIEQVDCILHLISAAVEAQETVDDSSLENCRTAVVVDENADHVEEHLTLSFPTPEAWFGCDAPQPTDPQCTEVDLPQAWSNGQAESSLVSRQYSDTPNEGSWITPGPWTLILQYGLEGTYTPTSDAVGVPSENEAGFAKLSDADINAIPSGGDAAYNYYWLTSDGEEKPGVLIRMPSTTPYDDTASVPFRGAEGCGASRHAATVADVNQCANWADLGTRWANGFDVHGGNFCDRWFQEGFCHNPQSQVYRCFNHGSMCQEYGFAHSPPRRNVKIYKFTAQ